MSKQAKKCKWKAVFSLKPERIGISQVKNLPNVKLVTELKDNNNYITAIEVITPDLSFVDAINYATLIANRCIDLISYIVGFGTSCNLKQMHEIGQPETRKTGAAFVTVDAIISKLQNIDLTITSFSNILQNTDIKLSRQLSHYRRGLSSSDKIEKIREFYQVLEDEYPGNHTIIKKYRYVRHLVSHAELSNTASIQKALQIVGRPYLDPSAPQDINALQSHLDEIKAIAQQIIRNKI